MFGTAGHVLQGATLSTYVLSEMFGGKLVEEDFKSLAFEPRNRVNALDIDTVKIREKSSGSGFRF